MIFYRKGKQIHIELDLLRDRPPRHDRLGEPDQDSLLCSDHVLRMGKWRYKVLSQSPKIPGSSKFGTDSDPGFESRFRDDLQPGIFAQKFMLCNLKFLFLPFSLLSSLDLLLM